MSKGNLEARAHTTIENRAVVTRNDEGVLTRLADFYGPDALANAREFVEMREALEEMLGMALIMGWNEGDETQKYIFEHAKTILAKTKGE